MPISFARLKLKGIMFAKQTFMNYFFAIKELNFQLKIRKDKLIIKVPQFRVVQENIQAQCNLDLKVKYFV